MVRKLILGLGSIAVFAVGVVFLSSEYQFRRKYAVAASPVLQRSDSAGLARGEHLFRSINCAMCHGADGGGAVYMDAGPIGLAAGPNLTRGRGGVGGRRSDNDLVRAIRHGVRKDSTSLILMPSEVYVHRRPDGSTLDTIMPWQSYRNMTNVELAALWRYLRSVPPKPFGK